MALRVTIEGPDRAAIGELVRKHAVDVVGGTARKNRDGTFAVDAVVPQARVDALTAAGYRVDVIEDADKVAQLRRRDIDWHPDDRPRRMPDIRDRGSIDPIR